MRISDWSSDVCSSDLISNALCDELGIDLRLADFNDVQAYVASGKLTDLTPQLFNIRTLLADDNAGARSDEHTSELQSLMRISYAVFCLKTKNIMQITNYQHNLHIHDPVVRHYSTADR